VGPCRLGFGITVAAGSIVRKDETRSDRLIMGGAAKGGNVAFAPGTFRNDKRTVVNNIHYIANLIALKQWYDQVRRLFLSNLFPPAMLQALQEKVDLAIGERIIRLEAVCLKKTDGGRQGHAPASPKQTRQLDERWPEIKELLKLQTASTVTENVRDQFLESVHQGISTFGQDYIHVIQGLDPADSVKGIRWLQGVIDGIVTGSQQILPSFFKHLKT
jgi:hypothetical protein